MGLQAHVGPSSSGESPRLGQGVKHPSACSLASPPASEPLPWGGILQGFSQQGLVVVSVSRLHPLPSKGKPHLAVAYPVPNAYLLLFVLDSMQRRGNDCTSPNLQTVTDVPSGKQS